MNAQAPNIPALPVEASEVEFTVLPISLLGRGDRRLEAETYLTGGYGIRTEIELADFELFGDLAEVRQPNRLKGVLVKPDEGIPFLTATQVFDIRPSPRKWVAPSKIPNLKSLLVESGTILVTRSGSVGDAVITFASHAGNVISDDLIRVKPFDVKHRGYLYTFLRSKYGRTMLRSTKYGSVIKHLEVTHLQSMPVPTPPDALCDQLDEQITHVYKLREEAFLLTVEAEELYAMQFDSAEPIYDDEYIAKASGMFSGRRRLDAYHFNPRAQEIERNLGTLKTVEPLSGLVESILLPNRYKRIFIAGGVPYLDSEDVFRINPEITKFIARASMSDLNKYFVKTGWVLLARSGQIYGLNGSVILANERHERKVVSEHIIRVIPRGIRPGYLAMALGHPILGRPRILRLAFGSSVPEIAPGDIANIPIPRLDSMEDEIADRMESASAKRMEADQIEDAAVIKLENELDRSRRGEAGEFENFEDLTKKLLGVSKTEAQR